MIKLYHHIVCREEHDASLIGKLAISVCNTVMWSSSSGYLWIPAGRLVLITDPYANNQPKLNGPYIEVLYTNKFFSANSKSFLLVEDNALRKKSFTASGKLSFRRQHLASFIQAFGGVYKNYISNNCNYLICNRTYRDLLKKDISLSKKGKKALQLGTMIITEEEFFDSLSNKEILKRWQKKKNLNLNRT